MRAVVCKQLGPPEQLTVEDLPSPEPKKGQVRVRVESVGLNFPDTLIIHGQYQFKPPLPFSPGSELCGVIDAVGEGVSTLAEGDRVVALAPWGALAEQVVIEASQVLPVPDGVKPDVAAGFVLTYGTGLYALQDRGTLQPGETLAVLGAAGGVGLAVVELGKKMGARVIACASTDEKLALCKEYGADELVNYGHEDLKARLKALTKGNGVDVLYDPVGGDLSEPAIRAMGWGGRFLVIGFAAGEIPKIPLNLVMLKGCAIVGVFWGLFTRREPERFAAQMRQLMGWLASGELRPHIDRHYALVEAPQALRDLMDRKARGKLIVQIGS